jgi:hypothetical protein
MILVATNLPEVGGAIELALAKYLNEVMDAAERALNTTAEDVMAESNDNAPKGTGKLVNSGITGFADTAFGTSKVEVGYTAPYAAHVHEDMEGRKPKFLEKAVMSVGPSLRANVIKELQ